MSDKVQSGFPPGFEFRRATQENEGDRIARKQSAVLAQQSNRLAGLGLDPNNLIGTTGDGLPDVSDAPMDEAFDPDEPPPRERMAPPPRPQQRQPQRASAPAQQTSVSPSLRAKAQHPVVENFLKRFGLKQTPTHELKLFLQDSGDEPSIIKMTAVADEVLVWALQKADEARPLHGNGVANTLTRSLMGTAPIVEIDGVPVWEAFGVELTPAEQEEVTRDRYDVPARVRRECASRFSEALAKSTSSIASKLFDFYNEKVAPASSGKVTSSFEAERAGLWRHVCPIDGCEVLVDKPIKLDERNQEAPYFCVDHGVELVRVGDLGGARNLPLG
jgi:hypothetical protein